MGSSLKGCKIASGQYDLYYNFGSKTSLWDIAAMNIIVEEAGGVFLDNNGHKINYRRENVKNLDGFKILNSLKNDLLK